MAGQLDDALVGVDRASDDVAPRVIRQGAEQAVEVGRSDLYIYNHTVVSARRQDPDGSPAARGMAAADSNHIAKARGGAAPAVA